MNAAARVRYTLVAGVTAVVIGSGFTFVGLTKDVAADTTVPSAAEEPLVPPTTASTEATTAPPATTPATTSPTPSATPSKSPSATPKPSPTESKKKAQSTTKPTRTKSKTAAPTATTVPDTSGSVVEQVLAHINAARQAEGLGALTIDENLSKAAALHTQLMIDGCGLSHQCSGEAGLGDRFSAQGVKWSSAGENIGFGSSGASDSAKVNAANGLTDSMLAETPPNDGHRKNLLNSSFKRIGLSVVRDSKGITWMTQDFVG
ncbi:CAP domain-containing protein [Actinoplanes sp. NPDC049596]|uniref:CAP domain-containing protein n=1 Tax=unclassified Actinoplanes TaxID=2626549 RepID=UPI003440C695